MTYSFVLLFLLYHTETISFQSMSVTKAMATVLVKKCFLSNLIYSTVTLRHADACNEDDAIRRGSCQFYNTVALQGAEAISILAKR